MYMQAHTAERRATVLAARRRGFVLAAAAAILLGPSPRAAHAADGLARLKAGIRRAYKLVIDGNTADLARHQRLAKLCYEKRKGLATGKDGPSLKYGGMYFIYQELAANNSRILAGIDKGQFHTVREAMANVVFLEHELERIDGRRPSRQWLTFQEVSQFTRLGGKFKPQPNGVLPYRRDLWTVAGGGAKGGR